jgi:hypothetical protein
MFQELGTSEPSSHCIPYEPSRVTSTTSKSPSQTGESLCRSLVICIFHRMKSPTLKLCELMLRVWYRINACWCFADGMTATLHNSSNLIKSSTQESFACSSENCCTQKDLCCTSVGNIALKSYIDDNGVWLVAWLKVVHKTHKTDVNSFTHLPDRYSAGVKLRRS